MKRIFLIALSLHFSTAYSQFDENNARQVHFFEGEFLFKGKLGSYHVKDKRGKGKRVELHGEVRADGITVGHENLAVGVTELVLSCDSGIRFFGGGEQFSHVELTGKKVPFLVEENGIGRGDQPATRTANMVGAGGHEWSTYCPIPLILSTDNKAYLIENDCYSEIDLSVDGQITFTVHDNILNLRAFEADSPKELIKKITAQLGRIPELPDWTYGTILGIQGGSERVEQLVKDAQTYGNPVSAIWIQDWVGKKQTNIGSRLRWEWKPDEATYPNFKQFCAEMNAQDIKVMGYINPFLLEGTDMTNEALSNGYVIHKPDGSPYLIPFGGFKGYIIDLSNPQF